MKTLSAVSGRGGLLAPIRGGTYAVSDRLVRDCTVSIREHALNTGGIAHRPEIRRPAAGIPSTSSRNFTWWWMKLAAWLPSSHSTTGIFTP